MNFTSKSQKLNANLRANTYFKMQIPNRCSQTRKLENQKIELERSTPNPWIPIRLN